MGEALPGESQEELERWAEEDRSLAREGMVELMDAEGQTYHKHIDGLDPWDVADRVRADTARTDWLAMRTQERNRAGEATPGLSHRQLAILKGAARGLPNRLIAERLHLSEGTVKRHLSNIYEKLGVGSRSEAVAKGVAEGWLDLEDIAPDGIQNAGGAKYRCVAEGCGREVLVVRESRDASHRGAPTCHGHKMRPVGSPVPENEGAREGS